jgi:transcriptional regulator GlxA family with amidase domain
MRRLLETSDVSIEVVAQEAGFGSALSLRQHFRATALRTSVYRRRRRRRA